MQYSEIPPHPALAPYIDAYWSVKGAAGQDAATNRILPDGCVDIIFNTGEDDDVMKGGRVYLVGTMTEPIDTVVVPGTRLQGIRFKPGAFSAFFRFSSLHEITDDTVECERGLAPAISVLRDGVSGLNKFFLEKLTNPRHVLFPILEDIQCDHGQVRVEELARKHFITARQLERNFKYYIGVGPKEFISQVRFRHALKAIRHKRPGETLSQIAFACGYYDHAHLTNEIKKYTGETPFQL